MALTTGFIGLPNVGKSTLFNALTKSKVLSANYPFATIEANIGVVEVLDTRVDKLYQALNVPNKIYPSFTFTDIAGLVKGASKGEGLGNQFLSQIREVDAICHVVRCFEDDDIIHVNGVVNPIEDIEIVNMELVYADLEVIEKRLPKIEKKAIMKVDRDIVFEYQILNKIKAGLEQGISARDIGLYDEQIEFVKNFGFLSLKPLIYVFNVHEKNIGSVNDLLETAIKYAKKTNCNYTVISAKIEEELSELTDEDKEMFLEELGIKETGLSHLTKQAYSLLNLATFFTHNDKEVRAWTFKQGIKASVCAGIVHTDFEKGFIRTEVTSFNDFENFNSLIKAREAGKMRLEGRDYIVEDGDIMFFRFNL